jgi:DNA repair protein RadC
MLTRGAESLTNAELLALIIRTGDTATKKSAIDLGRELISFLATTCASWEVPTWQKSAP